MKLTLSVSVWCYFVWSSVCITITNPFLSLQDSCWFEEIGCTTNQQQTSACGNKPMEFTWHISAYRIHATNSVCLANLVYLTAKIVWLRLLMKLYTNNVADSESFLLCTSMLPSTGDQSQRPKVATESAVIFCQQSARKLIRHWKSIDRQRAERTTVCYWPCRLRRNRYLQRRRMGHGPGGRTSERWTDMMFAVEHNSLLSFRHCERRVNLSHLKGHDRIIWIVR